MDDKNMKAIENIRTKFLTEFETNPQLYHQIDVERVRSENWQIERFILDTETEDEAYKALTKSLQWKNSFGLHERNDQYFPKEFFIIFGLEKHSRDKSGRIVMWNSLKNYRKISELSLLFQQFLAHQIEKLDREAGNKGWISVNDANGTGMTNVDMSLSKFRVELLNYYPQGLRLSLNVDMPWILMSVFKIVINFMNKKFRDSAILIKREQLTDFIDIDLIPVSFGGKRERVNDILEKYSPLHQLNHFGLNEKQIDNFYNTYKTLFERESY
jgi:hypothetical protein